MYADNVTESMKICIEETKRRRRIQQEYNDRNNITPQTIKKAVRELISISKSVAKSEYEMEKDPESMDLGELKKLADKVEKQMRKAAAELDFENAAILRDKMVELKKRINDYEK